MSPNPYITSTITCAAPNCGKVKQSTNHWFMMRRFGGDVGVYRWNEDWLHDDFIIPLCGDACVIKMVSMYLSDQKSKAQGGQT